MSSTPGPTTTTTISTTTSTDVVVVDAPPVSSPPPRGGARGPVSFADVQVDRQGRPTSFRGRSLSMCSSRELRTICVQLGVPRGYASVNREAMLRKIVCGHMVWKMRLEKQALPQQKKEGGSDGNNIANILVNNKAPRKDENDGSPRQLQGKERPTNDTLEVDLPPDGALQREVVEIAEDSKVADGTLLTESRSSSSSTATSTSSSSSGSAARKKLKTGDVPTYICLHHSKEQKQELRTTKKFGLLTEKKLELLAKEVKLNEMKLELLAVEAERRDQEQKHHMERLALEEKRLVLDEWDKIHKHLSNLRKDVHIIAIDEDDRRDMLQDIEMLRKRKNYLSVHALQWTTTEEEKKV